MDFNEAIKIVAEALSTIGTPIDPELYDGVIVKKMEASNTLDEGRTTNQTHIAITGAQMDVFPYLRADGYFDSDDGVLKKYFVPQIPVTIYESNYKYLSGQDIVTDISFEDGKKRSKTSVVRSKRKNAADQIQVSLINMDGPEFVAFRKQIHTGTYWILLKRKNQFEYDTFAVVPNRGIDDNGGLQALNNQFYKSATSSTVSTDNFEEVLESEGIKENYTLEELGAILDQMYAIAKNKTTAIHMFGLKFGEIIKRNSYSAEAIVEASSLSGTYHAEIGKGVRMYESISRNEFGIKFYTDDDAPGVTETKVLPKLQPRTRNRFPLNSILYGAPGTGKTYSTAQYALAIAEDREFNAIAAEPRADVMARYNALINEGRIVFTTFHQNYGYEEFIQGIRPDTTAAEMAFKTVDGVFKVIADKAMLNPAQDYVIIIDEINRANISKVFGELITLIEDNKRWGEVDAIEVTLPSGDIFAVPNNLYILGTMNSADKSISLIDTALRRRFDFVEFEPNAELIADAGLKAVLEKLNKNIAAELGSTDLLIGHSYFMGKSISDLCAIMNRNIIPLLYEYFFDNQKKVEAQVKAATEGFNVEIKAGTVGRIKLVEKGVE